MLIAQFKKVFEKPSHAVYWLAYTLSSIGFELVWFVLTVVLFDSAKTALSMGVFTGIFMFNLVVFGPIAGIFIDRWKRKRIFVGCNILLGIMFFSVQYFKGALGLYLVWFFISILFAFLRPARVALITNLFSKEDYFKANSAFMVSLNLSKIAGPLIGGFLILSLPMSGVVNAIASFFCLSSILVSFIYFQQSASVGVTKGREDWNWRDTMTGITFILSNEGLRFYILIAFLWRLFLASQIPLFIVYVKNYLQGNTEQYGLFMTFWALGGAIGSFVAGSVENVWGRRALIYGGLGSSYFFFTLLPLFTNFPLALFLIALSNCSFYIAHVAMHSDIQRITPNEIRGKVFSASPMLTIPIGLISIFVGTRLADQVGVKWVFVFSGLMALITLPMVEYLDEVSGRLLKPITKGRGGGVEI